MSSAERPDGVAASGRRWNRGERRRVAYVWRWRARLACHGSVMPCQYTDDPNDNHPFEITARRLLGR